MESKDDVKAELRAYIEENESILDEKGLAFVREILTKYAPALNIDFAVKKALEYTEKATYQAMEALVHNLNTMHSRAGAQIPFSSINYGTDTSPEGRMVIRNVLLATEAGLGNGETPIFPIHIFKVKEGVNFREGEPNYDLFKLACRVSAKRLFPNFSFIDAPFNLAYYKPGHPETEIAYMGCRTRVMANMNDPSREIVNGRGNLSFTSINLPRLGILGQKFMGLTPEQCVDMAKKYVKESLGAAEGTENTAKLMEYIDKPGAIRLIFNTEKPIPVEAFDTLSDTDPSIKLDVNTGPKTALELMADLEKK